MIETADRDGDSDRDSDTDGGRDRKKRLNEKGV